MNAMQSYWAIFFIIATLSNGANSCYEGELRVDPDNGPILQFCSRGTWGYICASNDNRQNNINADVACQQLGKMLSSGGVTYITSTTRLSPIFYFNFFTCTGYETKLKECRRPVIYTTTYNGECRNDRYAAAMCEPADCRNGDLMINKSISQFPLQFCARGKWNLLCGLAHTWTLAQAKVACRQLGLNPIGAKSRVVSLHSMTADVFNSRFHCRGNENSLLNCSYSRMTGSCTTDNPIAGVICGKWPKGVERLRTTWSSPILSIEWEHDVMNYYDTTDKDEDDDDDIWYTVYCRSDNETEETRIQVKTTSAIVTGLSPLTSYTCCVELAEAPQARETCETITTGPPNSTSQPNVTATPAAQDSDDVVLVGAGSALIGMIFGILLACFVAILIACCCRLKKKKKTLNFNNQDYNNHNNPGYSGLVKPEGFLVQQKSPEVVPLYDIIDRTVVDGPPDSAPTKYL